ncbi:MAG: zinc ribbon domain-containing protein [Candidatus Sericytochromatia bacterium]
MTCASCSAELSETAKFCSECGTPPRPVASAVPDWDLGAYAGPAVQVLVGALLQLGTDRDLQEADAVVEPLAALPTEPGSVYPDLPLLRLRALLARARGERDRLPRIPAALPRHGESA